MQPEYGVDLSGQVFRGDTATLAPDVAADISQAFAAWEPSIQLGNVAAVPPQSGDPLVGDVTLDVQWSIPGQTAASAQTGVSQATLLVGGTVVVDPQAVS